VTRKRHHSEEHGRGELFTSTQPGSKREKDEEGEGRRVCPASSK
jgi:hypothetical protein